MLTTTRTGTGTAAEYRVQVTDTTAVTARTKDNVATGSCTVSTDTSGTGWSDYTVPETVTADDTNGRCVIVTDAAGNIAKQHISDGDTSVPGPLSNIGLQAASDSGVADDDITNDTTAPVIEFTMISGATITARYRKTGAASWTTVQSGSIAASGAGGTVTLPDLADGDGDYEVEITQQETGKSAVTGTYTFTLDTEPARVYIGNGPFRPRAEPGQNIGDLRHIRHAGRE